LQLRHRLRLGDDAGDNMDGGGLAHDRFVL
jgi:hypothetical protein